MDIPREFAKLTQQQLVDFAKSGFETYWNIMDMLEHNDNFNSQMQHIGAEVENMQKLMHEQCQELVTERSNDTIEEILDLLPDGISVTNSIDDLDSELWYSFSLDKNESIYELSYYNWIWEKELVSFSGNLHEVASKMYEWCKEKGYIK